MKEFKTVIFVFLIIVFAQSCSDDAEPDYDPVAQLALDLSAIDEYIANNNLTVEIDDDFSIRYIIDEVGNGNSPALGDSILVNYDLFLLDGTFIETSQEQTAIDNNSLDTNRDYKPFVFVAGTRQVILGFEVSTFLLKEGGAGTFLIPSVYAYQRFGTSNIPPNANLIFKIAIVEIR